MLKQRLLTVAVVLPLFLWALFAASPSMWAALMGLVSLVAAWEWARLAKMSTFACVFFQGIIVVACGAAYWVEQTLPAGVYGSSMGTLAYGLLAAFWALWVPLWLARRWRISNQWLLGLLGIALLVPLAHTMLILQPQPWRLIGLMAVVWVADTAAYAAGRMYGRHKLAPAISPGKTWEGVAGAAIAVMLYVVCVATLFPQAYAGVLPMLVIGVIMLVLSIEGDLLESWMKRVAGVKDSGKVLPGHGGVLDRIDALTGALPIAAFALWCMKSPVTSS